MTRALDLPEYRNPPVTEVLLSLQFEELDGFAHLDVAQIYDLFKADFPDVQEHPPLVPFAEPFGARRPSFRLELIEKIPLPRFWFMSSNKAELIQFQTDRLVHNWRKIGTEEEYPRYEPIKERFLAELGKFFAFVSAQGRPPVMPIQAEIAYINHMPMTANAPDPTGSIFKTWNDHAGTVLGHQEEVGFRARFPVLEGGRLLGHLTAEVNRALDPAGQPSIQLSLTARGKPLAASTEAIGDFLDIGRDRIVRGFTELTTEEMHRLWGRIR